MVEQQNMETSGGTAPARTTKRTKGSGQAAQVTTGEQTSGTENRPTPKKSPKKRARRRKAGSGVQNRAAELAGTAGVSQAPPRASGMIGGLMPVSFTGEAWNGQESASNFEARQRLAFDKSLTSYVNHMRISHRPLVSAVGGRTQ